MRKHLRLYAIVLTAFYLVGIMAAAAAAVAVSAINVENISNVAEMTVEETQDITVNVSSQTPGNNDLISPTQAFTYTVTSSNVNVVDVTDGTDSIDGVEQNGSLSALTGNSNKGKPSTTELSFTLEAKAASNSAVTITVTITSDVENYATVTKTFKVNKVNPKITPVVDNGTATFTWGSKVNNGNGITIKDTAKSSGTWTVDETGEAILDAAGLKIVDASATDAVIDTTTPKSEWKPDMDALKTAINGGEDAGKWRLGESLTADITLTKTTATEETDTATYTLTFNGIKLAAKDGVAKIENLTYDQEVTEGNAILVFNAYGPGSDISVDVTLPDGLSVKKGDTENFLTPISVYGTPTTTCKGESITFKFTNDGGITASNTVSYSSTKFTIAAGDEFTITVVDENGDPVEGKQIAEVLPGAANTAGADAARDNTEGQVKVNDNFTTVYLKAVPGPVTWTEDNLTATGLKFEQSGDEYVKISGTFDTARTDKTKTSYTLTATNNNYSTVTGEAEGDVMVWTVPTFDNSYIFEDPSGSTKESKKTAAYKVWKSDYFTTNSDVKQEIPVSNFPEAMSWDVSITEGDETPVKVLEFETEGDTTTAKKEYFYVKDTSGFASATGLTAEVDNKGVLYLVGSSDRAPKGGKIKVSVTAKNYAGETTKDYTVMVVGTTPALAKKNDMTLNGYGNGNSADIAITAGDPTITMTAKIEAKTAKKIFGIEKDIDLLADGPKYGIYVSGDMANGQLKIFLPDSGDNNGTNETQAYIDSLLGENEHVYKGYAFKKLPIVITAKNPDITYDAKGKAITDKKIATQKATLSTGNMNVAPYWVAPEAKTLYDLGLTTASNSADLGKKQVIYVPQNKPLADADRFNNLVYAEDNNPYYFDLVGHGPFDVVVKPTEKGGIKAAVTDAEIDTDEDGTDTYTRKRVTFTGTPSNTTKDVATAFSLTAKNPSTGKSAKLSVSFTAVPTPKVQEAKIGNSKEKPATVGKKVKVAPKITSNSKKIGWKIDSVEWNGTTFESDTVSQDLYDIWGLALDKKGKGSIEGTATAATGTTNPLTVVMHAYTKASDESEEELTTSDPVTATIYIAGEKPKLGTKKVTVTIDDTTGAYNFDNSVFEIKKLDNAKADDTESNPVITALGENKNRNHYVADMEPTDTFSATAQAENTIAGNFDSDTKVVAAKGLSIKAYTPDTASDAKYNTFKLDGEPAGATKKETVQIAMNNWGTIQTDKLTVTIVGQTPVVEASTESLTDLPETSSSAQKITFTVSNAGKVGSKIKWKITSKPSSGVKAKLVTDKSKPTQATVEITTKKATAGAETSVTVSATDSDTKKAGTAKVALTVKAAAETKTEDTPTVVDDTKAVEETKTEEKALGEGEVHFGRERTAAGLTAAQRKFLADNGYVIAAVLPEIEVTEAGGQYALEVDELEEAAATGAELVYFAFSNKPTDDDEIVTFADLETGEETTVLPASRKLIVEPWFNVGTKYAPVIAVKAAAGEAEAATEEDVKAKAEEKAEEAAAEGTEAAPEVELKEVKDKDAE